MNHQTLEVLQKYIDKISGALTKIAPTAWHTMMAIKQVDSISKLVGYIGWALFFSVLLIVAIHLLKKHLPPSRWSDGGYGVRDEDKFNGSAAMVMIAGTISLVSSIVVLVCFSAIINVWLWVGLFNPQIAIAHDIVEKILNP